MIRSTRFLRTSPRDEQEQNATLMRWNMSHMSSFTDSLDASNAAYVEAFSANGVPGRAGTHLLLLTCMDSRIVPHAIFGLKEGDMKVVRNAGGQMNSEVERDIVLASHLLDCHNIVIMPHTKCAMASLNLPEVQTRLTELSGMDFSSFEPRMIEDWEGKLRADVASLKANKLLNEGVVVRGARYDVDTGMIHWVC